MSKTQVGVVDQKGQFHPTSGKQDVASAIATAQHNANRTGQIHHLATRDASGRVTRHGAVKPAAGVSNQLGRSASNPGA